MHRDCSFAYTKKRDWTTPKITCRPANSIFDISKSYKIRTDFYKLTVHVRPTTRWTNRTNQQNEKTSRFSPSHHLNIPVHIYIYTYTAKVS